MRIKEALDRVVEEKLVHFQMPGHKGRLEEDIYKYDYTEIPGTDNLFNPQGPILKTMEAMSKSFGSKKTFLSVNGATGGIIGSMAAAFSRGDEVIIMRGTHISVYDGVYLLGLRPLYLYEDEDYLSQLKRLVTPKTKGVVLVSPDYYGAIIDDEVFQWIRDKDLTLVVDEAHGSHLKLIGPGLSAMDYADLVIQSFHKTLPSMTQTAVVHLCTDRIKPSRLAKSLKLFQSTSPNYVLMRSLDMALDIYDREGKKRMDKLLLSCKNFKKELEEKTDYYVNYRGKKQDPTRLFICHKEEVDYSLIEKDLRKFGIQIEFSNQDGLLMMPSIMSQQEDFDRLLDALSKIEVSLRPKLSYKNFRPRRVLEVEEAFLQDYKLLSFKEAVGRVVAEYVIPYPPGSPILVPGEEMDQDLASYLEDFQGEIVGLERVGHVAVVEE